MDYSTGIFPDYGDVVIPWILPPLNFKIYRWSWKIEVPIEGEIKDNDQRERLRSLSAEKMAETFKDNTGSSLRVTLFAR